MPTVGNTLIVGIIWIAISVAVGIFGSRLSHSAGFLGIVGWIVTLAGFGFAVMSGIHLIWMVTGTLKALKWQRHDPAGFAKTKSDYERAMRNIEEEEQKARAKKN
jgi:hypothetical protein